MQISFVACKSVDVHDIFLKWFHFAWNNVRITSFSYIIMLSKWTSCMQSQWYLKMNFSILQNEINTCLLQKNVCHKKESLYCSGEMFWSYPNSWKLLSSTKCCTSKIVRLSCNKILIISTSLLSNRAIKWVWCGLIFLFNFHFMHLPAAFLEGRIL